MNEQAELVERARSGDREALQLLLTPHLPGLTGYVRLRAGGILRQRESCSDVVQSVCSEVIAHIADLRSDSPAAFRQWLFRIAKNKIHEKLDHHLAQRRDARREVAIRWNTAVDDESLADCYLQLGTPSREAMTRERIEQLEAAFDQLPDDYREVLILHRLGGLSHAEVAAQMGRTEVAVRKLLHRARARLAMMLPD